MPNPERRLQRQHHPPSYPRRQRLPVPRGFRFQLCQASCYRCSTRHRRRTAQVSFPPSKLEELSRSLTFAFSISLTATDALCSDPMDRMLPALPSPLMEPLEPTEPSRSAQPTSSSAVSSILPFLSSSKTSSSLSLHLSFLDVYSAHYVFTNYNAQACE